MDKKHLYCLGQHFAVFYEYCKRGKVAEMGQPCVTCKYVSDCDLKWTEMALSLQKETGIQVHFIQSQGLELIETKDNGSGQSNPALQHNHT